MATLTAKVPDVWIEALDAIATESSDATRPLIINRSDVLRWAIAAYLRAHGRLIDIETTDQTTEPEPISV